MKQNLNIIHIDNIKTPELDLYANISESQLMHLYEPDAGIFIAESPKVIERALADGYEPISFLLEEKDVLGQMSHILGKYGNIPIYTSTENVLLGITGFKLTRGALCAMRRRMLPSVNQIVNEAKRIVVLENVMNPTNIGAIFRSAAALGMDAVLLTHGCSDPLYRRAIRVSMGTVFQVPWTFLPQADKDYLDQLHEMHFKTVSMALCEGSISIDSPALKKEDKLAILMGTEGDGLCTETIRRSDYIVNIPMAHEVDSLNVAAASAVAFWELGKR